MTSREALSAEIGEILYDEVLIACEDSFLHEDKVKERFLKLFDRELAEKDQALTQTQKRAEYNMGLAAEAQEKVVVLLKKLKIAEEALALAQDSFNGECNCRICKTMSEALSELRK